MSVCAVGVLCVCAWWPLSIQFNSIQLEVQVVPQRGPGLGAQADATSWLEMLGG